MAIQVARAKRDMVVLRQTVQHHGQTAHPTTAALGLTMQGSPLIIDIAKMPHMLIAGATGSGKSVALNTILCSMLYCATPIMTQFVMIDPKQVELSAYAGLPHLATPIITSAQGGRQNPAKRQRRNGPAIQGNGTQAHQERRRRLDSRAWS